MYYPESAAPVAQRVATALLAEIAAGTLTARDWEVEGPHWHPDAGNGRVRYYTHVRPSGTVVRVRYHNGGDSQNLSASQFMVLRDAAVIAEATGPEAQPLVSVVHEMVERRLAELRGEVEREFGG